MKRAQKLPTTSFALLGMLSNTPMSGYDLVQAVKKSIAFFWPVSASQIYSELPRLEGLGYLEGDDVAQERLPDKRVYRTTPEGEAALEEWLSSPGYEPDRYRSGVHVKLFFGHRMTREHFLDLVARFRAQAEERRGFLAGVVAMLDGIPEAAGARATALMGLRIHEAVVSWADEVSATFPDLSSHRHPPEKIAEGARRLFESAPTLPEKRRSP